MRQLNGYATTTVRTVAGQRSDDYLMRDQQVGPAVRVKLIDKPRQPLYLSVTRPGIGADEGIQ